MIGRYIVKKLFAFMLFFYVASACADGSNASDPFNAVVRIDSIIYRPNYYIPWQNKMREGCSGTGVVIAGKRILTTAHNVTDATYITVKKQTADEKFNAKVLFIDHDCDLALLAVEDESFFEDILPFEIGQTPLPQTPIIVAGFPIGGDALSITQGVVSRIEVQTYVHSWCSLLAAQLDAAINPGNSGGPVFCDERIVGIAFQGISGGEGLGYMIPTEIIRHFLQDTEDGHVEGFGSVGFRFGNLENPDTRRYLKMKAKQAGVRITWVCKENEPLLKPDDVLLAVDGIKVANNGNVRLPNGEPRLFTTLITQKQIGETVELNILRDGKKIDVLLPVRKFQYLCKGYLYDSLPDYYITGGFVFTTLSYSFLEEWGRNTPPPELTEKMFEEKLNPEEEVVVLSLVLGDRVNVGYQGLISYQLNAVNGRKITNLKEFISIIENSKDEFITMTFGAQNYPVTLDLAKLRAATPDILERYRIPADRSKALQQ